MSRGSPAQPFTDRAPGWPRRLVAAWAKHKADDLRRWERNVRKAYREGTPLGDACGPYADALLECAAVMERCAERLATP